MLICLLNIPIKATAPPINTILATIPKRISGFSIIKNVVIANTANPTPNDFNASPVLSNALAPFLICLLLLPSSIIAPPIKTKLMIKNGIATIPTTAIKPARANPLANDNSEVPIKSRVLAPLLIVFESSPRS